MKVMQFLTLDRVINAARDAYYAGTLAAQAKEPEYRRCMYKIGPYRCAIGAALNDDTLKAILATKRSGPKNSYGPLNEQSLCTVIEQHVIELKDDAELSKLQEIQGTHDNWCNVPAGSDEATRYETKFRELVGA